MPTSRARGGPSDGRGGGRSYGCLNVLFNNAGIFPAADGGVLETDEETWDLVMRVNLKGVFLGCKYGIPALLRAGGGSMVNTASFVALMGAATPQIAYTASKGGVLSLTRETAVEFARRGIRVNALCPGPVDTPLMAELLGDPPAARAAWSTSPSGGWPAPPKWRRPRSFSPPTSPPTSTARP